jgi:hemolysin D
VSAASTSAEALRFSADITRLTRGEPSARSRGVLYLLLALLACMLVWMCFGKLDIVAVSSGKLVPQSFVKIVQPAEAGIVREILVTEGDAVREGDILVRMDARLANADATTVRDELHRKRLQLRRIDAELAGSSLKAAREDPPELVAQLEAQMRARRQAHADAVGTEEALRARSVHDLGSALEIESKLRQTEPMYREQAQAWEQLAREGFAGRLLALDRRRTHVETEQELKAQQRTVESLRAAIAGAEKRIAQINSNYRQQLHSERSEAAATYQRLQQDSIKLEHRHALLELRAPQAGIVKDLATHTPGTVLSPGAVVLTLVPQNEPLVAEVWVTNADSGFVQAHQKARIKVAAYPFQKYGLIDGVVEQVSADAQDRTSAAEGTAKPLSELAYRARVRLLSTDGGSSGALKLVPGMAVTAEVHIGRRTVLEYLLSPIQKAASEAARER